jgi:hypothetical protein
LIALVPGVASTHGSSSPNPATELDRLDRATAGRVTSLRALAGPDLNPDPRFVARQDTPQKNIHARNKSLGVGAGLIDSTPEAEGIDRSGLKELIAGAKASSRPFHGTI